MASEKQDKGLSPVEVLWKIAESLPVEERKEVIIVGSLAAGFYFFGDDKHLDMRTKDVDCMIARPAQAPEIATGIAEELFRAKWQMSNSGDFGKPGNAETATDKLPLVRLYPPEENKGSDWFLELLCAPDDDTREFKSYKRVVTSAGHFALAAFNFFRLMEFNAVHTVTDIRIAHPAMSALSNLLHHPVIGDAVMSGEIAGREIKRSNKDLGRVIALFHLTIQKMPEDATRWSEMWRDGLMAKFPEEWRDLLSKVGTGIEALLSSDADIDEALHTCNAGLLSSRNVSKEQFVASGRRFLSIAVASAKKLAAA